MTHTKEPWTWEEHELSTGYSAVVYDPDGMAIDTHLTAEKADHIANCMNACAGLNPAAISDVVEALRELVLTKQIHDKIWSKDMSVSKRERDMHQLDQHKERAFLKAEQALSALQVQS